MQIIKPIVYALSAAAVIVAPAFIENKIVPLIEAALQSLISNL